MWSTASALCAERGQEHASPAHLATGYHPIVDDMPEQVLVDHVARVHRAIANGVAAMPSHQDFIDRYCKALPP